jgi:phosphoglucosamine mutase
MIGRVFEPLPQRLKNCKLTGGKPLEDGEVQRCIEAANDRLSGHGRLLVRPSGTEPLIRVMVEADDESLLSEVLDEVTPSDVTTSVGSHRFRCKEDTQSS